MTTCTATTEPRATSLAAWSSVGLVMLSTFIVVTSEMLPVGVLTPMADGLGISPGLTGSSLTITGLTTAVTAPLVTRYLGDSDRRTVMALALLVLALGNVLTAMASGFAFLFASRVVLGVGMGVVWGMAAVTAARLVAKKHVPLAVSLAVSGVASASVLGVPLGTFVGNALGWRAAFVGLAAAAVLLAVVVRLRLPELRRPEPGAGVLPGTTLWRPPVVGTLVVVALLVTAHFAAYTYVRPVLERGDALSPDAIALLLLLYGVCGLAGNFAAGAVASRRPRPTFAALALGIAAAVAMLAALGSVPWVAAVSIAVWGVAYGGVSVAGQLWVSAAAPDHVEQVTGVYVGIFTASIAMGALLGGVAVGAIGIAALLWLAAGLAGLATATIVAVPRASASDRG